MKLLYCKMDNGNFGDDLNEWFWERVAPGLVDGKGPDTLIGIGTLLQDYYTHALTGEGRVFVVGAGAGSKGPLPKTDDRWNFLGVRGPLTASYLGLSPDLVCGDPAILVSQFEDLMNPARAGGGVGFMPHVWSLEDWDWEATCKRLGIVFVDPTAGSKQTIRQISGLDKLVTEAMHGAIVADAMRVPWIAVDLSDRFEPSKWCDWAGSLGVDLHFRKLHQLRRPNVSASSRLRTSVKDFAMRLGRDLDYVPLANSSSTEIVYSERQLKKIAFDTPTQLSETKMLNKVVAKLEAAIAQLIEDAAVQSDMVPA